MTVLAAGYTLFMTGTTITHNLMKKDYFSRNTASTSLAILAICPGDTLYESSQDSALPYDTTPTTFATRRGRSWDTIAALSVCWLQPLYSMYSRDDAAVDQIKGNQIGFCVLHIFLR